MQIYIHEQRPEQRAALERSLCKGQISPIFLAPGALDGAAYLLGAGEARSRALLLGDAPDTARYIRNLRSQGHVNPAIVLSDRACAESAADFLDSGADDVLPTGVDPVELAARVRSIQRRYHGHASDSVEVGEVRAFFDDRNPEIDGVPVALTRREQEILQILVRSSNRMVTKETLYESLYSMVDDPPLPKVIDVHICTLRKKLSEATPSGESYIVTVARRGYRFGLPRKG